MAIAGPGHSAPPATASLDLQVREENFKTIKANNQPEKIPRNESSVLQDENNSYITISSHTDSIS